MPPANWEDLQDKVCKLLCDMNLKAEVTKEIETVRGKVEVDVFAENIGVLPNEKIIVECKHWNSNIPQSVVHSFRTVVTDYGANAGYLISKIGFQSGAFDAAKNSNVHLMTFEEFQENFKLRYLLASVDNLVAVGYPFRKYVNWSESCFDKEIENLSTEKKKKHSELQKINDSFSMWGLMQPYKDILTGKLDIEGINWVISNIKEDQIKGQKFDSYSGFFDFMINYYSSGLNEFDDLFGKKLRKHS